MSALDLDCTLRLLVEERIERCPQERCAFWEPGGAVLRGACMIDRLHVDLSRPELAAYLLELRDRLEHARPGRGPQTKGVRP